MKSNYKKKRSGVTNLQSRKAFKNGTNCPLQKERITVKLALTKF